MTRYDSGVRVHYETVFETWETGGCRCKETWNIVSCRMGDTPRAKVQRESKYQIEKETRSSKKNSAPMQAQNFSKVAPAPDDLLSQDDVSNNVICILIALAISLFQLNQNQFV